MDARSLQEPKFWLLGVAAAIAATHLTLVNRADDSELFALGLLFWVAAGSLLWERRHTLVLNSSIPANILGVGLIALLLSRGASLPDSNIFLRAFPFIGLFGLALMASGFRGLRQYWRELLIFGLLAIQSALELVLQALNLSEVTARSATFLLHYIGFQVQRQDTFLYMSTGRVQVYGACSGVQSILLMLSVAVLFLLMFPLRSRSQKIFCLIVALAIGFLVNSVRVALMAMLVAFSNKSFEYWHGGGGSLVFSAISVLLFGVFCWVCFLRNSSVEQQTMVGE